jgi:hypothetical protein
MPSNEQTIKVDRTQPQQSRNSIISDFNRTPFWFDPMVFGVTMMISHTNPLRPNKTNSTNII